MFKRDWLCLCTPLLLMIRNVPVSLSLYPKFFHVTKKFFFQIEIVHQYIIHAYLQKLCFWGSPNIWIESINFVLFTMVNGTMIMAEFRSKDMLRYIWQQKWISDRMLCLLIIFRPKITNLSNSIVVGVKMGKTWRTKIN